MRLPHITTPARSGGRLERLPTGFETGTSVGLAESSVRPGAGHGLAAGGRTRAGSDPNGLAHGGASAIRVDEPLIPQYRVSSILAVWAAAALPMAALAWVVAPMLARTLGGGAPLVSALLVCMTAGLVWQCVLVLVLVRREQGTLRWSVLRNALWLRSPRSPKTGQARRRLWFAVVPFIVLFAAEQFVPSLPIPGGRDFGAFLEADASHDFFHGSWGWFALVVVMGLFNTIFGEELLFRGFLLPRMQGSFGRADWLANGLLFALYHLHTPWVIPTTLIDTAALSLPTKRYRSAWMGIMVHSTQTMFISLALLSVVA